MRGKAKLYELSGTHSHTRILVEERSFKSVRKLIRRISRLLNIHVKYC